MNHLPEPVRIMVLIVLLVVLASLVGCAGKPQIVETKVPVPVECRAQPPARPAMPTEALADTSGLDQFVQAAAAEIELREGYETELRAALASCITPLPRGPRTPAMVFPRPGFFARFFPRPSYPRGGKVAGVFFAA